MPAARLPDVVGRQLEKRSAANILRAVSACAFLVALVWLARPVPLGLVLGLPCIALGLLFRVWAAGHLVKTKELATSGPYRHVQHPLYFGRFALGTGFCLVAWHEVVLLGATIPLNLVLLAVFWAVFLLYYIPRKKRVEGARLLALHGEAYRAWASAVPLLIPRLRPHGAQRTAWSRARFEALDEKYTVLIVLAAVLLILVKAA